MSSHMTGTRSTTASRRAATAVAVVFVLVGVMGFIPGVTTGFDRMSFAGHGESALLLGVFAVSVLHNLVHFGFGLVGLLLARTAKGAVAFLIGGGVVYLALWLYGLAVDHDSAANFVPINTADNWLHLALGVGMVALGLATRRSR